MARYTELFSEWLKDGGELPAVFNDTLIDGNTLGDIFTAKYADREIGFETPTLFELKLNGLTMELIPELQSGLKAYSGAFNAIDDPTYTHTKSGEIVRTIGPLKRNTYEQPTVIEGEGLPLTDTNSQTIITDSAHNDTETYQNVTDTDVNKGVGEGIQIIETLSKDLKSFLQVWIEKFDCLFMQIY